MPDCAGVRELLRLQLKVEVAFFVRHGLRDQRAVGRLHQCAGKLVGLEAAVGGDEVFPQGSLVARHSRPAYGGRCCTAGERLPAHRRSRDRGR